MATNIYKNWWLLTLKGILAIIFGIFATFVPGVTLITLMIYFGLFIILSGIFLIVGSISHKKNNKKWGMWLFEGILDIIIGLVVVFYPKLSLDIFIVILAIWAISIGFTQLFSALNSNHVKSARWLMLINAVIVIVFAIVLFINPFESAMAMTYIVGIFALLFGIFITVYSFKLKDITKE